jgi:hypothetical protein
MYNLTGIPGWIRFGSSPGFAGGNQGRGFGPCAEYLEQTGQLDNFIEDLKEKNPNVANWQQTFTPMREANPAFEKQRLTNRIKALEQELKELKKELKEYR